MNEHLTSKPEVSDKKFVERLRRQADDGHGWNKAPAMMREAADRIDRLRAALERAERVTAMVSALSVTTEELRRIRNAGWITFDKIVYAITTCLIDMREALRPADETAQPKQPGVMASNAEWRQNDRDVRAADETKQSL